MTSPNHDIALSTTPTGYRITDTTTGATIVDLPMTTLVGDRTIAALATNFYAAIVALFAGVTDPDQRATLAKLIQAPTGPGNTIDVADYDWFALGGLMCAGKITLNYDNRTAHIDLPVLGG